MKQKIPIFLALATVLFIAMCPAGNVRAAYTTFLSDDVRQGKSFIFTYTVTPVDQSRQSPLSVDIPIVIDSVMDINATACNVTYTATFKILVNGIPKDHVQQTIRTITNAINSTEYVYTAKSPWDLFFTNNNTATTARRVNIPSNASLDIGYGTIVWGYNGVLNMTFIRTVINGMDCFVSITQKISGPPGVPGYSEVLVWVFAAIPVAVIGYKIYKKLQRASVE